MWYPCNNAKEMYDKFEVTHEETNRVNELKTSLLTLDYELFKVNPSEGIKEMFHRSTDIINGLKALGKSNPNKKMMKKMFNSLPKSWEAKSDSH
ncbi:hypothetical protein PVK06_031155 [Gossypium arboreum]|uniref:UBN2 domain-containing protein n=1 Tax=Gossypium arboreum TaxID=29729 RepID=A0ABR0NQ92_GOSAR|nr:hypothetical protein PVK06_031155 [Gossypium arboreum]